ncbi:3-deoxy-D-manno-octulosonic-acid transferase [Cribrihabitans marinus]|uniref:3-deoxy-D-manno-octulosonic acid transferase n=1 Tax=Cribrihabitans marinus TaxID=1227549 RepID=A0A1H6Y2U6_9RHOB|nr:glycosyltransferase N-terminal domain-containing protein [Cribrihabitans marinus]GGH27831.1 3-deoxy-D-manno-octulosonic acid transferase [Cribrihabitans marinus]SEJ31115.1 3-deoxy-D-manno-octulosonic-acid transferase [Cribrihabitans marinus]
MSRSLSLAAYRALNWRNTQTGKGDRPPRPEGELLWVQSATRRRFVALAELCRRLMAQRPGLQILFTAPGSEDADAWREPGLPVFPLPADHMSAARGFLDHWRPDMCVWAGGGLLPNLLSLVADREIPSILLDVGEGDLPLRRHRWLPDLTRATLDCFDTILVKSEQTARSITRSGVSRDKVSVSAEMRVTPNPVSWSEEELASVTEMLAARPVWLACWVHGDEIETVLQAHRSTLRLAHRLLLVLHLADPTDGDRFMALVEQTSLRCADWDAGDAIEDSTQILLTTMTEDLGLWFRMAPVSFMGSSLTSGTGGREPLTAVALGSAVLYGPNVRDHIDTYSRLAAAGAARSVRDAETLSTGVVQTLAPNRAAEMALAGWQVVTEGAYLNDQLVEMIQDRLDERGSGNARA